MKPLASTLLVMTIAFAGRCGCATPRYVVPEPLLQAFSPAGLQVSIPDSEGLEIFAFHGSVNKPLKGLEAGDMSRDIVTSSRGRWVFDEPQIQLLPGDIIYYWLYVQRNGLGYRKDASYWIVEALQRIPEPPTSPPSPVQPATQTVPPSAAQVIIESLMKNNCTSENTNSVLNRDPLLHLLEGYEFVMVVKNGKLQLKDRQTTT